MNPSDEGDAYARNSQLIIEPYFFKGDIFFRRFIELFYLQCI